MKTVEIKKALYKEKPTAESVGSRIDETTGKVVEGYRTVLSNAQVIYFWIPEEEYNTDTFTPEMPAQLLIRWINN